MCKLISINIIVEAICFLSALLFLAKDKDPVWKSWIFYLLAIVVAEEFGLQLRHAHNKDINQLIYNILLILEIGFPSILFIRIMGQYLNFKPVVYIGNLIVMLFFVFECISHGVYNFNNLTATIMSVLYFLYGFCYYYLLIKDETYVNLKYHAAFWWVTGAVFFYFGTTVCNLFFEIIATNSKYSPFFRKFIYNSIDILLYSFWSYSFLCRYRQRKSNY